jgi:hypothetical protein
MKKLYLLALALIGLSFISDAQKVAGVVRGILQDSVSASPLADATVSLMDLKDSSLISFTLTQENGRFEIRNIDAGKYQVVASYTGLQSFKKSFTISSEQKEIDLGVVQLLRTGKLLDEVIIEQSPVQIKGDTIAFRADAFKTKPNATVEDLLKKLPGVQVEKDGTVKAQGETVQKVYVDGKEFFSNDPKLATKNLTADMIDQVEVYDDMSEQAKFNGIDDGSRTKAINLKLKKDKKRGTFGRVYGGVGTDERYDAGLSTNFFKGATQVSVIGRRNNTNNMGFTMGDQMGMFSGGGNMSGPRGGGGGNGGTAGFGGNGTGLTTTSMAGINYRDLWGKKLNVNGSYFYNHANRENFGKYYRQTFFEDTTIARNQQSFTNNINANHRFNYNIIYNIDSFNSIIYTPNISFQNSESFSEDTITSFKQYSDISNKQSAIYTKRNNTGNGFNMNNNLIWRRKFRRAGRTLSVNLNSTVSESERESYNIDNQEDFDNDGNPLRFSRRNYLTTTDNSNNSYGVSMSYTEPIGRNKILELNYSHNGSENESDRRGYDFNTVSGKFDQAEQTLTNHFQNRNSSNRYGTNFRLVKKKYNFQVGVSLQNSMLETNNMTLKTTITNRYTNLFPTASFNYQFARSKNLRFSYRGSTSQPSSYQLDSATDRSRYPYLYKGNPFLDQEVRHGLTLSYTAFDPVKFRNMFAFISFNATQDKIVNSVRRFGTVELNSPVNLNGAYNISGNFNIGFPIKKLKGGNINFTTRGNYIQDPNLVNDQMNYTRNAIIGEDVRLNYNFKDKLDVGVSAGVTYNSVQYTGSAGQDNSFVSHAYSIDATWTMPKGFILSSDFDYNFYTGRTDGFNQSYVMWNAGLGKRVFKNKRGEFKLSVFDLLNQNVSINRIVERNYIEDIQNTVLRRFLMLSFTYHINRMGGKNIPAQNRPAGGGGMRMTRD